MDIAKDIDEIEELGLTKAEGRALRLMANHLHEGGAVDLLLGLGILINEPLPVDITNRLSAHRLINHVDLTIKSLIETALLRDCEEDLETLVKMCDLVLEYRYKKLPEIYNELAVDDMELNYEEDNSNIE